MDTLIHNKLKWVFVALVFLSFAFLFFAPNTLRGQITPEANLRLDPAEPAPGDTVRVFIDAYSLDIGGASIRWYVDDTEYTPARAERSMVIETGPLGFNVSVRAEITPQGGAPLSLRTTVAPTAIDLIVEAETRTPAFYKGRALPAPDEPVTAVVIPYTGVNTNAAALVYTWKLGGTVLFGGPIVGKTRATFTMPKRQSQLEVEVSTQSGAVVGHTIVRLSPADSELYFYEDNPLRGMVSRAIGDTHVLIGEETTVRAEPYFVSKNVFGTNPDTRWTINGQVVSEGEGTNLLTLRRGEINGGARIGFSLTNRQSFLQSVSGSFTLHSE